MGLNLTLVALTLPDGKRQKQKEASARWRAAHLEDLRKKDREKDAWKKFARENHPDEAVRTKLKDEWNRKLIAARIRNKKNYRKNPGKHRISTMRSYARIKADPVAWRKRLDAQRDRVRKWRKQNPEKMRAGIRRWHKSERGRMLTNAADRMARKLRPEISLKSRIRSRTSAAVRKFYRGIREKSRDLLGCDYTQLRAHLESLFVPGMTWDNRAEWEIDHIRPCASFDVLDPEQRKCCFHYTNLQPLWKSDNRKKSDKWA